MDRRRFLQLVTGAGIATATMAEAGFFAEFWKWATKRPTWFIPKKQETFYGVIHPQAAHDLLYDPLIIRTAEIPADVMVPELAPSLQQLATVYYDRKAVDALKANIAIDQMHVIRHILNHGYGSVKVKWHK